MELDIEVIVGGLAVIALFIAILVRCFRTDND